MRHASMTTEREILESCACHKVRTAARAITRAYDDALRPVGLRATQLTVLVATASDESVSITALAKLMGMDRTTLTRNLRPLEAEGGMATKPHSRDYEEGANASSRRAATLGESPEDASVEAGRQRLAPDP